MRNGHTYTHLCCERTLCACSSRRCVVYLCQRYVFEQFENCTIGMRSDLVAMVCASRLWENVPYHSSSVCERIAVRNVDNVDKGDGARSGRHRRIRIPSLLRCTHSNHSTVETLSIHKRWGDRTPSTAIHITTIDELRRCDAKALGTDGDRCYWMRWVVQLCWMSDANTFISNHSGVISNFEHTQRLLFSHSLRLGPGDFKCSACFIAIYVSVLLVIYLLMRDSCSVR